LPVNKALYGHTNRPNDVTSTCPKLAHVVVAGEDTGPGRGVTYATGELAGVGVAYVCGELVGTGAIVGSGVDTAMTLGAAVGPSPSPPGGS
jgi:hypothetical protein